MKEYLSGLSHIGIPCKDLQETIQFYKRLGFEIIYQNEQYRVVFLQLGSLVLECYCMDKVADIAGAVDHFAIDCSDVKACYQEALRVGHTIISNGIESLPYLANGIEFFIILGPNNEKVEFLQKM